MLEYVFAIATFFAFGAFAYHAHKFNTRNMTEAEKEEYENRQKWI